MKNTQVPRALFIRVIKMHCVRGFIYCSQGVGGWVYDMFLVESYRFLKAAR